MNGDDITLAGTGGRATEPAPLVAGARVGRYTLVDLLGRGAMGAVYRARDPELGRTVALKLLVSSSRGHDDRALDSGPLLREARALARLAHPNVVAVLDVGEHDGQLFLAMELVEGTTLAHWLGEAHRDWRSILAVAIDAGTGLAAAHDAGLVHRDVKPSNVLVGHDGRARVTDFGLARHVDAGGPSQPTRDDATGPAASLAITAGLGLAGTPRYMAPERFDGASDDPRSDQFAFCVTLYEALWKRRPFSAVDIDELRAAVRSGRVRRPPAGRVPARVRAAVLRGLQVDPADRFESMHVLVAELAAAREHRRAPTLWLALGGVGVVAVAATLAVPRSSTCRSENDLVQELWTGDDEARVRTAMGRDVDDAAVVDRVVGRVEDRVRGWARLSAETCRARAEDPTTAQRHDRRSTCLAEHARRLAAGIDLLATAAPDSGIDALALAERLPRVHTCEAVPEAGDSLAPPDPAIADAVVRVRERVAEAYAQLDGGRAAEAAARAPLVADVEALHYPPVLAEVALLHAYCASDLGRADEAHASAELAYLVGQSARHDDVAREAAVHLVWVQHMRGEPAAALAWARRAEAALATGGDEPLLHAQLLVILARVFDELEQHEVARELYERGLAEQSAVLGPDDPKLVSAMNGLASLRHRLGEQDAAEELWLRALAIREQSFGAGSSKAAVLLHNLGDLARDRGRYDEARSYLEQALAGFERGYGREHPEVARTLNTLAVVASGEGHDDQALALLEEAAAIWARTSGRDHPDYAAALVNIGDVRLALGDAAAAIPPLSEAVAIMAERVPAEHPTLMAARSALAQSLLAAGRHAEALATGEVALQALALAAGQAAPQTAAARIVVGEALGALGRHDDAIAALDQACADLQAADDAWADVRAIARFDLARALRSAGREPARARALADAARRELAVLGDASGIEAVDRWLTGD